MSGETPYDVARRLDSEGVEPEEIERELYGMRLGADEVRIAMRAAGLESGAPQQVASPPPAEAPDCEKKPAGIAGWLLIPALQFPFMLFSCLTLVLNGINVVNRNPHLGGEGLIQAVVCGSMFVYTAFTTLNFFRRKKRAVPLMLGFYGAGFFIAFVMAVFVSMVSAVPWIAGSSIGGVYFFLSKRVQNTFTR